MTNGSRIICIYSATGCMSIWPTDRAHLLLEEKQILFWKKEDGRSSSAGKEEDDLLHLEQRREKIFFFFWKGLTPEGTCAQGRILLDRLRRCVIPWRRFMYLISHRAFCCLLHPHLRTGFLLATQFGFSISFRSLGG